MTPEPSRDCPYPGKGSFSNPHVNAPRDKGVFGSLLIVYPTPHEGGALVLKHGDHEWSFDHSLELAAAHEPSIGYVALLDDFEFEVMQVISGHLVTLTYDLYDDDGEPESGINGGAERLTLLPNERAFREEFKALLENPEFLPDGGTLGFGLRHVYPINSRGDIKYTMGAPKGSDAVVYWAARALGFEPLFYVLYELPRWMNSTEGGLIGRPINFSINKPKDSSTVLDINQVIRRNGGIIVCQDPDSYREQDGAYDKPEKVEWVTPRTTFNEQKSVYFAYGNHPELRFVYGKVCLVVRIGKAGERLAYPTSAQLEKVWEKEGNERPSAFWNR